MGLLSLDQIRALRRAGHDEEAHRRLVELAQANPGNPQVLFEAASVHDYLDLEEQAVGYYVAAIEAGLSGAHLREAYLGLGSTYRLLGRYKESLDVFDRGSREYPDAKEFRVFSAMTYYNLGRFEEAIGILLRVVADTSDDSGIQSYGRAIRSYAANLDRRSRECPNS